MVMFVPKNNKKWTRLAGVTAEIVWILFETQCYYLFFVTTDA